jgi:hypothetical protein
LPQLWCGFETLLPVFFKVRKMVCKAVHLQGHAQLKSTTEERIQQSSAPLVKIARACKKLRPRSSWTCASWPRLTCGILENVTLRQDRLALRSDELKACVDVPTALLNRPEPGRVLCNFKFWYSLIFNFNVTLNSWCTTPAGDG